MRVFVFIAGVTPILERGGGGYRRQTVATRCQQLRSLRRQLELMTASHNALLTPLLADDAAQFPSERELYPPSGHPLGSSWLRRFGRLRVAELLTSVEATATRSVDVVKIFWEAARVLEDALLERAEWARVHWEARARAPGASRFVITAWRSAEQLAAVERRYRGDPTPQQRRTVLKEVEDYLDVVRLPTPTKAMSSDTSFLENPHDVSASTFRTLFVPMVLDAERYERKEAAKREVLETACTPEHFRNQLSTMTPKERRSLIWGLSTYAPDASKHLRITLREQSMAVRSIVKAGPDISAIAEQGAVAVRSKAVRKGEVLTDDQFRRRFRYQMRRRADLLRIYINLKCAAASALRRKDLTIPDLVKKLQAACTAWGAQYKNAHLAPVDEFIMVAGLTIGGQVNKFHALAQKLAKDAGVTISRTCTRSYMKEARIFCARHRNYDKPENVDQYGTACSIKFARFADNILVESLMGAFDCKMKTKPGSSSNTDQGQGTFQSRDYRLTNHVHSANAQAVRCALSGFSIYIYPTGDAQLEAEIGEQNIDQICKVLREIRLKSEADEGAAAADEGGERSSAKRPRKNLAARISEATGLPIVDEGSHAAQFWQVDSRTEESAARNLDNLFECFTETFPHWFATPAARTVASSAVGVTPAAEALGSALFKLVEVLKAEDGEGGGAAASASPA